MPKVANMSSPEKSKIPTAEDFRSAVKYYLVNEHGMPDLVAEEALEGDLEFIERQRQKYSSDEQIIVKTADSLAFEPTKGVKWLRLENGERKASKDHIVVDVDGVLGKYLDRLVVLGFRKTMKR